MAKVEVVHKTGCKLGEAPHWDSTTNTLLYVDIFGAKVHRYNPANRQITSVKVKEPTVAAVIPRKNGGLVISAANGVSYLDESTGEVTPIVTSPLAQKHPNVMMNDAKCDSEGRMWAGVAVGMKATGPVADAGELYCITPDGTLTTKETGVSLTNGLSWSPDNKVMYYTDSWKGVIYAYDFDAATGNISNRRDVVTFDRPTEGVPDGHTIDTDGNMWVAMMLGGYVVKVNPKTGEKLEKIVISEGVKKTTCCQFGGENLDELYVTTGKNDEPMGDSDLSGSLFKITGLGVIGLPANVFAG